MNTYRIFPKFLLFAVTSAAVGIAGCKSNPPAPPATPAGQQSATPAGTVNSDGTPATSQPVQPAAQPVNQAPPPPPPVALVAPRGTRVVVRTNQTLSASRNEVGDAFSGVLEEPIISHGTTLFSRGTRVSGTVVAAKGRGRFKGEGAIGIEIASIGSARVHTSEYEKESKGKGKRTGTLIGGGAGLGALIGGLAGGGKGAVIGGLAGAGAGTAGAAYTGNKDVIIPSESVITFSLLDPLTVQP